MRIYFARHGETALNVEKRMMGSRFDEPLNDEGERQAFELARGLATDFGVIISSPLKRALQTAEYIKKVHGYPIEIYPEFREFDGGLLSGMKWEKIEKFTGGKISLDKIRGSYETDYSEFGGESIGEVRVRLQRGIERIKIEYAGIKVFVVTHAGVLRALYGLAGKELTGKIENASVIELEV